MAEQAEQPKTGPAEGHPPLPADAMIILPVRQTVLFPGIVLPLAIGRKTSIAAAQEAVRSERMLGVVLQRDPAAEEPTPEQLHAVGTAAQVLRYVTAPDGTHHVVAQGVRRFRVVEYLRGFPFLAARIEEIGIAELGKCFKVLKREGCAAVCYAGLVARPDFGALKPDMRGVAALPGIIAAARHGDDALLRRVLEEFAKEGFAIEGAHEAVGAMTLPLGLLGKHGPAAEHKADIERALEVAREIGRLDVGQGAVVCNGLVLAVEAQEGTDAMLRRCAELGRMHVHRGQVAFPDIPRF